MTDILLNVEAKRNNRPATRLYTEKRPQPRDPCNKTRSCGTCSETNNLTRLDQRNAGRPLSRRSTDAEDGALSASEIFSRISNNG
jgi:hypothetical protein